MDSRNIQENADVEVESENEQQIPEHLVIHGKADNIIRTDGDESIEAHKGQISDFYFSFGDGTILHMFYTDRETWNLDIITEGDGNVTHYNTGDYTGDVDVSHHSEVVTIKGYQAWMAINGTLIDFTESKYGLTHIPDLHSQK